MPVPLSLGGRVAGDPGRCGCGASRLVALIPYLVMPFDLVPDFIPVAGYLDDAVIVAFALRFVLRGNGPDLIEEHWPGPQASLAFVLRLSGYERREVLTPPPP